MTHGEDHEAGVKRPATTHRGRALTIAAALVAALVVGATGLASSAVAPTDQRVLGDLFFGKNMARAEVVLVKGGVVHDYRIDQGKVVGVRAGAIELLERDGTRQLIPVAPTAQIWVNGRLSALTVIPLRLNAVTIRDGDQPAEVVRLSGNVRKP